MEDNKSGSPIEKRNLKYIDKKKSGSERIDVGVTEIAEMLNDKRNDRKKKRQDRKSGKIPPAVDIAVAIFVILFVAAIIVGAYFLLRHYVMTGYTETDIEYTVIISGESLTGLYGDTDENIGDEDFLLDGRELYYTSGDSAIYFGKIKSTSVTDRNGDVQVVSVVELKTQFKHGEGYFADGKRIAVGGEYNVFSLGDKFRIAIVEIGKGDH